MKSLILTFQSTIPLSSERKHLRTQQKARDSHTAIPPWRPSLAGETRDQGTLELYKDLVTSTIASLAPCSPTSCSDSSGWPLQRGWVRFDIARTSATLTRALQGTMNGAESTLAQWSSCCAIHSEVSSWAKMPSWIPSSLLSVRSPAAAAQPLEEDGGGGTEKRREPPI